MASRSQHSYGAPLKTAKPSKAPRAKPKAGTRSAFDVADEQIGKSTKAYKGPKRVKSIGGADKDNREGMIGQAKRNLRSRPYRLKEAEKK